MGWPPRKKAAAGGMTWEQEICSVSEVAQHVGKRADAKWLTKHIIPLPDGTMLLIHMQSSLYAPKPVKVKKARAAKSLPGLELELT